ncbi:MAG: methyltransferase domain-containing protein [Acidobacteria bacterium]|nr:methyltransferase domain-containing protein [Acidobacteriota bacterium]
MVASVHETLLTVLRCPACNDSELNLNGDADGLASLRCVTCGGSSAFRDGVLYVESPTEVREVGEERVAVALTESEPKLGGWTERYTSLRDLEPGLASAYLSLPYGDGSRRFAEPGYFANVNRFTEEFDFIAGQLPRHGLLLDIGADATWSTARLAARGLTCVALDITDHLKIGELYHTVYPPYARINVDMHAPVFQDGVFDVVTAFNALHHSKHLNLLASRIASMLKPGGMLGFVEPYVQSAEQRLQFGVDQSNAGINENIHTIEEWNDALSRAGLRLVTFALSDSLSAIYRKEPDDRAPSDVLRLDSDGCFVHFYRAVLDVMPAGCRTTVREPVRVQVAVHNASAAAWASRGPWPVTLGYHVSRVSDGARESIAFDNPRTGIDRFLVPGETRVFDVRVPLAEPGVYEVEFDLVHETRSWFHDRGGRTATMICEIASDEA